MRNTSRFVAVQVVGSCVAGAIVLSMPTAAEGATISLTAIMSGANEVGPNSSPGTGFVRVDYNDVAHTLFVQASFSGLLANTTAAHIHSAAAPGFNAMVATQTPSFAGFPLGVTSGTFSNTFDLTLASSWNPAFITAHGGTPAGAEMFLAQSFRDGTAYFNVHTTMFGGGEIRGNLQVIPAPLAAWAGGLGFAGVMVRRRSR
jgi:hypothetical protein